MSSAADELRATIAAYWKPHAIACAARLGIADAMDGSCDAGALARKLDLHPEALARFLRALASFGLVTDEGGNRFALTATGAVLRADHPESLKGMALHMANNLSPSFAGLGQREIARAFIACQPDRGHCPQQPREGPRVEQKLLRQVLD